jgi:hypothetical protein
LGRLDRGHLLTVIRHAKHHSVLIDVEADVDAAHARALDDPGKRLLRDPEQRDGCVGGELRLLVREIFRALEPGARAGLLELPAQRGDEADIVEQRRSQLLDDAAFQVDAGGEVLLHAVQALAQLHILRIQALFGPRDIHARPHQQSAELIVQLASERCLLALGDTLQVRGELDQLAGARLDFTLELGALLAQAHRQLLATAHVPVDEACGGADQKGIAHGRAEDDPAVQAISAFSNVGPIVVMRQTRCNTLGNQVSQWPTCAWA